MNKQTKDIIKEWLYRHIPTQTLSILIQDESHYNQIFRQLIEIENEIFNNQSGKFRVYKTLYDDYEQNRQQHPVLLPCFRKIYDCKVNSIKKFRNRRVNNWTLLEFLNRRPYKPYADGSSMYLLLNAHTKEFELRRRPPSNVFTTLEDLAKWWVS